MRYISNFVQKLTKLFRFKRSVIKGNSVSSSVKEEVVENNCDDLLKEKGYEFTKGERVNFISYCETFQVLYEEIKSFVDKTGRVGIDR